MTSSPNPQDLNISGDDRASGPTPQRPQQLAWGPPGNHPQTGRRGLAPISTALSSNTQRPSGSSQSPRNPWSPSAPGFSSTATGLSRVVGRSPSTSSSSSPFGSSNVAQPQSQTGSHLRNITSPIHPSASSTLYGSGQAGSGATAPSRLARASPSIPQLAPFGAPSPVSTAAAQTGNLSKIVVAQLFLLLSTLKEDKDKAKWDSQVDQIRKVRAFAISPSP